MKLLELYNGHLHTIIVRVTNNKGVTDEIGIKSRCSKMLDEGFYPTKSSINDFNKMTIKEIIKEDKKEETKEDNSSTFDSTVSVEGKDKSKLSLKK